MQSYFQISPLSPQWAEHARLRQSRLTKPAGSLGQLEEIAIHLASIQETLTPSVRPARALIFASDHPVVVHGVSAFPQEVTTAMVANMIAGGAASSVLARQLGIPMSIIDVGVKTSQPDVPEGPVTLCRQLGAADGVAGDLTEAQAMDQATFDSALAAGIGAVDGAGQCGLLIVGELGIGNTTAAAAVAAALLDVPAEQLVGRGTGLDDEGMVRKRAVVERALAACDARNAAAVIAQIGGRDIAAMYGAIGRAVEKKTAVLLDGFVAGAAALALVHDYPEARQRMLVGHRSAEQGHRHLLAKLSVDGLLDLGLRLGEASGALTAFPLLASACALHNEMATFEDAHVPDREPT